MNTADHSYIFIDRVHERIESQLSCSFGEDGGFHFAWCSELDITDQGESQREAFLNLVDAIIVLLQEAVEAEQLDAMLGLHEFSGRSVLPERKVYRKIGTPSSICVPFSFEASLKTPKAVLGEMRGT